MIIFLCIALFFFLKLIFKTKRKINLFNRNEIISFSKKNLNKWMKLTKKQRYKLSEKESSTYLNKRKVLLEEIREEYKRISQRDFGKK